MDEDFENVLIDEFKPGLFYYAERVISNGEVISGWSYCIDKDNIGTYSVFVKDKPPVVASRRIDIHTIIEIINVKYDHLLLFRDMPIIINPEEREKDGVEYYFSFGVLRFCAYNIPRMSFVRPANDATFDYMRTRYPDEIVIFDLFDRVTQVLRKSGINLTYKGIEYIELGEIEQIGIDDLRTTFDLPKSYRHSGTGVDAYTNDSNEAPVFCECSRKSIENTIKLCKRYLDYLSSSMAGVEIALRELGLPEYYQKIVKESGEKDPMKWTNLFRYEEKICPFCSGAIIPQPAHYVSSPSKFEQRYEKEINKRFTRLGIRKCVGNLGIFFLEEELPDDVRRILMPTNEELIPEICACSDLPEEIVSKQLLLLDGIPKEAADVIRYGREFSKIKKSPYELTKEYGFNEDFVEGIEYCLEKRYKQIKKSIFAKIKEEAKAAEKSKKNGGSTITITEYCKEDKIQIVIEKEAAKLNVSVNEKDLATIEIKYEFLDRILKHLDYDSLKYRPVLHVVGKEKKVWEVKGAGGDVYYGYQPLQQLIEIRILVFSMLFDMEKKNH